MLPVAFAIADLIPIFLVLTPLFAATRGLFNTAQGVFLILGAGTAFLAGMAVIGVGAALTFEQLSALAVAIFRLLPP
jgi:hypothetical protein